MTFGWLSGKRGVGRWRGGVICDLFQTFGGDARCYRHAFPKAAGRGKLLPLLANNATLSDRNIAHIQFKMKKYGGNTDKTKLRDLVKRKK